MFAESRDYSVSIKISLRAGRLGFNSWQEQVFFLHYRVQNGFGARAASCALRAEVSYQRVKRTWCEVDHSLPSTAEIKKCVELYFHSPNTSSWHDT